MRTLNVVVPSVDRETSAGDRCRDGAVILAECSVVLYTRESVAEKDVGVETGVPILVETESECVYSLQKERTPTQVVLVTLQEGLFDAHVGGKRLG